MSDNEDVEILLSSERELHGVGEGDGPVAMEMQVPMGTGMQQTGGQESSKTTGIVVLASVMAALGGVLFGYDIGIVAGALLQLQITFNLSCLQKEIIVSSMLIGALVGSLCGGFIVDQFGRRFAIIVNAVIFFGGAIILAVARSYALLLFGRLLVGFAVSLSAIAECIYISEISPVQRRGLLVSLNELGITIGLLVAYLVNYLFMSVDNGWRYMFGLSALPAICQGVGMLCLPRSPRYLMLHKEEQSAREVLQKLLATERVDQELANIRLSVSTEHDHTLFDLFRPLDNMRGRMLIGGGLVFFQQFTGQPNVLYYAPIIFQSIGFHSNSAATLATVGLGVVKVVSTVVALVCVDRAGRRRFLLAGATLMMLSIACLGIVTHVGVHLAAPDTCRTSQNLSPPNETRLMDGWSAAGNVQSNLSGGLVGADAMASFAVVTTDSAPVSSGSGIAKYVCLISLMTYVCAYAFGFGPVTWLILSEIFPAGIKGRAIATATILNWGTNLLVSLTFLDVLGAIGTSWTFISYGFICFASILFIYVFVPETKNKSLEKISKELNNRGGYFFL
ncbi:PREDICTED: solute carrier family 2, facilitated glucose transporter member 12-like isoform X2 [Priapulus caudatus]|uniref:Solute carrier family 2, facilitated glucose transporter member 12-like isoform X2 n=1 Tax=Priapulus caudatus TaxID=37621 RepID=A0ABM1DRY9_PRICU|nr:PREDICTED: solute carrier family 2, facilitated glucose transporter member 12-like isoform X2 [Priapulus caudatus]